MKLSDTMSMQPSKFKCHREMATMLALLIAVILVLFAQASMAQPSGGSGGSGGGGSSAGATSVDDPNATSPAEIRDQYGKRYPFAKTNKNDGEGQETTGGGNLSYQAYSMVMRFCKDDKPTNPCCGFDIHYMQMPMQGSAELPTQRDKDGIEKGKIHTEGLPVSDTQFQIIDRENRQRLLEMFFDPERWMWVQTTAGHMVTSSMSNSVGGAAENTFKSAFGKINEYLPNIANESTGQSSGSGTRSLEGGIYIVQQMYKTVFVPMALLFLLPGVLLTQLKGNVHFSFLGPGEDAVSPFEGILRAIIAIFLIPATQLIVSYAIDVGNSMAYTVRDPGKQWIQESSLMNWVKEQTYNPPQQNVVNAINPPRGGSGGSGGAGGPGGAGGAGGAGGGPGGAGGPGGSGTGGGSGTWFSWNLFGGGPSAPANSVVNHILNWFFGGSIPGSSSDAPGAGGQGKAVGQPESEVMNENQLFLSSVMQIAFNGAAYLMSTALGILTGYQLVFMCYLFLLGPISACFFAWPGGVGSLFRPVFSKWVDAVIVLALWKFYWCVILAVMTQHVTGVPAPDPHSPLEMMIFNSFLALLLFIPFQPFNFRPGDVAAQILDQAAKGMSQAAAGAGGGPGGGASFEGLTQRRQNFATQEFTKISATGKSGKGGSAGEDDDDDAGSDSPTASPKDSESPSSGDDRTSARAIGAKPNAIAVVSPKVAPPVQAGRSESQSVPPPSQSGKPLADNLHSLEQIPQTSPPVVQPSMEQNSRLMATTSDGRLVQQGLQSWQDGMAKLNAAGLPVRPPFNTPQALSAAATAAAQKKSAQPAVAQSPQEKPRSAKPAAETDIRNAIASSALSQPPTSSAAPQSGQVRGASETAPSTPSPKEKKKSKNDFAGAPPISKIGKYSRSMPNYSGDLKRSQSNISKLPPMDDVPPPPPSKN